MSPKFSENQRTLKLAKPLFALSVLLHLCGCRSDNSWAFSRIDSQETQFNSTKLTFASQDPIHGIDLELVSINQQLHLYLNVHSVPIPSLKTDPQYAAVRITIGTQESQLFEALRREGGQRLLLPETAMHLIIDSLKNHIPVHIAIHGYQTSIEPTGFLKYYQQMHKQPLFQNPFHLPI